MEELYKIIAYTCFKQFGIEIMLITRKNSTREIVVLNKDIDVLNVFNAIIPVLKDALIRASGSEYKSKSGNNDGFRLADVKNGSTNLKKFFDDLNIKEYVMDTFNDNVTISSYSIWMNDLDMFINFLNALSKIDPPTAVIKKFKDLYD